MSNNQLSFNPVLTNISRERGLGEAGIGTRLFPLVRSTTGLTGEYPEYNRTRGTGNIDTERGPSQKVKRVKNDGYEMKPYKLSDHTVDVELSIEFNAGAIQQDIDEITNASNKALRIISEAHERKVHAATWASSKADFEGIYTANHVDTPSAKWSSTSAKMLKNVKDLAEKIENDTGFRPNTMLLTKEVYNDITGRDNEIREAIKYTGFGVPTLETIARYFEVERVLVPGFLTDSANPGQAASFSKLWSGDNVGLFNINANPGRSSNTLGVTFFADQAEEPRIGPFLGVQPWYDIETKSDMFRCNAYFKAQMFDNLAGGILWDVL